MPKLRAAKWFLDNIEILKFGNLASYFQNVNYYWNTWNLEGESGPQKV